MSGSFNIIILLAAVLLIVLAQLRLSHTRSRWPGLILPALGLLLAIAILISRYITGYSFPANAIGGADGPTSIFIAANDTPPCAAIAPGILTAILVLLYLLQRRRMKKQHDMDKTRIQDL